MRSFELTSRGCPRLCSPVKTRISYGAVVGFKIGVAFQLAVVDIKADEGSVGGKMKMTEFSSELLP